MERRVACVLVADDLTGASDAGVQFVKAGLRTTVRLDHATAAGGDRPESHGPDALYADVVVVDMDSRALAPDEAYERMRAFLARRRPRAAHEIVKKMDSTLRGNTGPEVRALLDALPGAIALVCPAYPKNGRTCRNGVLFVDGVPVDQTDLGRDLFTPVRDSCIAAQFDEPTEALPLSTVRAGGTVLDDAVERMRARAIRVAVADAETDDDLRTIAALQRVRDDVLWVSSAGLLEMLDYRRDDATHHSTTVAPAVGPVVLVVGSIGAMTQRQIADFGAHGDGHTELLDAVALLDDDPVMARTITRAVARASGAVLRGTDTLIALDGKPERVAAAIDYGRERGWDARETSRRLREALVATVDGIVDSRGGGTVVLSGGDVARAFCERRGIRGMTVLAEKAPGIPISRALGADLFLVTKAGGFGRPETYREVVATLHWQVIA